MASGDDTTDDQRWLVVDGRRWRRTDPELPDDVTTRLRSHLGAARSAVRVAKKNGDDDAVAAARERVGAAKHGLGERGPRWWDDEVEARVSRARDALEQLDLLMPPKRADGAADVNA
ncbi:biopolymer transporter Tol [Microbacterium testaceum]|uniref:biopolymer transporter Tol n=1 Tax=Microbacterium testaceum TaxID=2033 RepID=UPI002AC425DE|nr:biopolymer transporter Tol [Microbacterium testaceum]MDZ5142988.1 biopolymer transporter Tol [Microbacterium testaceum]